MALACLCAADRHHQLDTEILPALHEDNSEMETGLYVHAVVDLQQRGWPVASLDATTDPPETIAAGIVSLIQHVLTEKSPACL